MPAKYWNNTADCNRANKWKTRGLKHTNEEIKKILELFHECKNCQKCNKILSYDNGCHSQKCMDHDHDTGKFRAVLCRGCNIHHFRTEKPRKKMSEEQRKLHKKMSMKKHDEKRRKTEHRKNYNKNYNIQYREKNKETLKQKYNEYHCYIKSWGGNKRSNNNLLCIDVNLFI